jgi:hypothetical protein
VNQALLSVVLRCEPRVLRRMPVALLVIAAGLGAWVLELGVTAAGAGAAG